MQTGQLTLDNNQTIYYEQWGTEYLGKAPSVIFVHGNFSNSAWWHDTINGLTIKRHLVAVDQRGFGKSSYNTQCTRLNDWAQDLKNFCQKKGIEKCVSVGWSFGGAVSMKFAEIAPELVTKIILTCSVSDEGLSLKTGQKPCKTPEEIADNPKAKFMMQLLKSKDLQKMKQVCNMLLFTHSKDYPEEKKNILLNAAFQQRCYPQLLLAIANSDINIDKIKAKCLMIHGKHDLVVPLSTVKGTGEHFKNFIIMEENAHMIPIESPKEYNQRISEFIQE